MFWCYGDGKGKKLNLLGTKWFMFIKKEIKLNFLKKREKYIRVCLGLF